MLPATRASFYVLDTPEVRERETLLARLSGKLSGRLPQTTCVALAQTLEGINSYYSNLIEGQSTRPIEAEQALSRSLSQTSSGPSGDLVLLSVAHIRTERRMRAQLCAMPALDVTDIDFIRDLHLRFVSELLDTLRIVSGPSGLTAVNTPGAMRRQDVEVGAHLAPAACEIISLLGAFSEAWSRIPKTPAHILLAHHRFAWIHPFLDGSGRTARLLTTAMLAQQGLDAGGLWSISRGLAKRRADYYSHLGNADASRRGDFDGRGTLSLKAAIDFTTFMMDVCEDQIRFMAERLQIDHVKDRMARFCAERALIMARDTRAAPLLLEAMFIGRLEWGAAQRLLGLGERAARMVVSGCVEDGLLTATSTRADLMPRYPVYAAAYLFPHLFEIDDPQAAMRETLLGGR